LPELVTHHVLGDVDRDELVPVVDRERVPDELGRDRGPTRPRLEHATLVHAVQRLELLQELRVHVRTLLDRTAHAPSFLVPALRLLPAPEDHPVRELALAGLLSLGEEPPRRARMPPARGLPFAAAHRMVDGVHGHAADAGTPPEPA